MRPTSSRRHPALVGTAPWIALLLVGVAWDVLGLDSGPHEAHLTISALSQAYRPLNDAMLLVWMLAGVGYGLARARAPLPPSAPPPLAATAEEVLRLVTGPAAARAVVVLAWAYAGYHLFAF